MGFNHQQVGEKILAKWNFPEILRMIVLYYNNPEEAPAETQMEVSIVHIANVLSLMSGIGVGSDGLFHEISPFAIKKIGLTEDELMEIFSKIPETLKQLKEIL